MLDGDERWLWAGISVVGGLLLGILIAWWVRRLLSHQEKRAELKSIASSAASFFFWLALTTGVVLGIGFTSPETLRPIPSDLLAWLPNALIAGLLVLGGYAVGIAVSATLGRALEQATGRVHHGPERLVRLLALGGASILALGQLGVRTTVLTVIVAGVVFGVAGTAVLLAGLGGRQVAGHLAASRTLRAELQAGDRVITHEYDGVLEEFHATTIVLLSNDGRRVVVPYGYLLSTPFEIERR